MFSSGVLGYFALKVRPGWHLSMCFLACTAMQGQKKWSGIRSSMHTRPKWPTSSWHPPRAVSLCAASRTSWNRASCVSLGRVFLQRMTCLRLRWLCSERNCHSTGGSVGLRWHWPRVPSCSLIITRLKTRSASWAWYQSSRVMQVTCGLSLDRVQDVQIAAICFDWACGAFKCGLLHGLHGHCSNLEVSAQGIRHAPWPGHPQQGHPHQCWVFPAL